jgi:hypothetical protein
VEERDCFGRGLPHNDRGEEIEDCGLNDYFTYNNSGRNGLFDKITAEVKG